MVLALTLGMTMSYCDRYVFNLVVEPIKRDLALTDTAVSLVQGFAFSMFFVVSGLPLGLLVDRARRLTIVAVGILLWSVATLCLRPRDQFRWTSRLPDRGRRR